MTDKKITLCLNMIVKNESKIIKRLLDSVINIIDTYCICDTGSTDDTCEIIEEYFKGKNILGKIVKEPFKNFEYNRTFAMKSCYGMSDYILLLDADMILNVYNFDKQKLDKVAYHILQGNDAFFYQNIRIVKNIEDIKYIGVTHEYLSYPNISPLGQFNKNELFITDIGDGGSKSDKYERDIRLLTEDLKNNPKNSRTVFYLANSYFCISDFKNAIHYYELRIKLGDWEQEVWYSYYRIGLCYQSMNKMEKAVYSWLQGFNFFPERLENLYEIIKHYRIIGQYKLFMLYYNIAKQILSKIETKQIDITKYLFLQNDIYEYKIYDEYLIVAFYVSNDKTEYNKLFKLLLNNKLVNTKHQILSNHKFYAESMQSDFDKHMKLDYNDLGENFYNSTPSICFLNNDIYVNIRFVSYLITETGQYDIKGGHISTRNKLLKFDSNFNLKDSYVLNYDTKHDDYYQGIEDIRLVSHNNKLYFNGVRPISKDSKLNIVVEHGHIDFDKKGVVSKFLSYNKQTAIEKNWVAFVHNNALHHVYSWSPLLICKANESVSEEKLNLEEVKKQNMPAIFSMVRGSTNGIKILDEIWFMCHIVSHESKRFYYHILVVLDAKTLELKRYSKVFTFRKTHIEYCLGLAFNDNNFYITYSTMDNTSELGIISYDKIQKYFL
jgi:tetratricopeptide (TPR) repeat protein